MIGSLIFVVPYYVLPLSESTSEVKVSNLVEPHIPSNAFKLIKLMSPINHRMLVVSGPNGIFPLFLKHLPYDAYLIFLNILNLLWLHILIPPLWKKFKILPIPKSNGEDFQHIFLSSFCKMVESI